MDPLTPLDTLCRIILRAREYEAQTASDYDAGEDPDNVDAVVDVVLKDAQRPFLLIVDIVGILAGVIIACGLRFILAGAEDDPA